MKFRSLQQRFFFLLILPVLAMLAGVGLAGFLHARDSLLEQWRETALFSLERAAHSIEMRLSRPLELVQALSSLHADGSWKPEEWEAQLRKVPGVVHVILKKQELTSMAPSIGGMHFDHARARGARAVKMEGQPDQGLTYLVFDLQDEQGNTRWRLDLTMRLDFFLEDLRALNWWGSSRVLLVDQEGKILAEQSPSPAKQNRLGEKGDTLEAATLQALQGQDKGTILQASNPAGEVSGFYNLTLAPWSLVLFAPARTVLAPVEGFLLHFALASLGCLILVALLMRLVTGKVAQQIQKVSQAAAEVARGQFVTVALPTSHDEINHLALSFNQMIAGLQERDYIRDTFGRYMDEEVARRLMARPEATRLGGKKRAVAIMMTDVRGFTAICDSLTPEQTITLVNRYLSWLIEAIQKHKGIIVDFLGDSCLVFFDSLDSTLTGAVQRGLCCAQAVVQATENFNSMARQEGWPELQTGIGVHAGDVVVGNIGSQARTKYGIVGGPVNETQRIQSLAEGGEILISQAVYDITQNDIEVARAFTVSLKGLEGEVRLYSLAEGPHACDQVE